MFEAPSVEDRLLAVDSSPLRSASAGGPVAWQPAATAALATISVAGPILFYHQRQGTAFSVLVTGPDGDEFRLVGDQGRVDGATTHFDSDSLSVQIQQSVLPSDTFLVEGTIVNRGAAPTDSVVDVVLVSSPASADERLSSVAAVGPYLEVDRVLSVDDYPPFHIYSVAALALAGPAEGSAASAVRHVGETDFRLVPGAVKSVDGAASVRSAFRVDPGEQISFRCALSFAESNDRSRLAARLAASCAAPDESTRFWMAFLGSCPSLRSSNGEVEQQFSEAWVRSVALSSSSPRGPSPYREVFAFDSEGRFADAAVTARSVRSDRWNHSAEFGRAAMLNFLHFQRADGALPTRIRFGRIAEFGSTCADWSVFWDHFLVHPDESVLHRVYHALADYARYVRRVGDANGTGLCDLSVRPPRPDSIFTKGEEPSRYKSLAATVYQYRLTRALERAATRLGLVYDASDWQVASDATRTAVRENLWNPQLAGFGNLDKISGNWVSVGETERLLPYATDLVEPSHISGIESARSMDAEVGQPQTGPESLHSLDRIECLAIAGDRFGIDWLVREAATLFLRRVRVAGKRMGWREQSCREADIVDVAVRFMCGLRPQEEGIAVKPLPFLIDSFSLDKVVVRNNLVGVWMQDDQFGVRLDGEDIASASLGETITLDIPA